MLTFLKVSFVKLVVLVTMIVAACLPASSFAATVQAPASSGVQAALAAPATGTLKVCKTLQAGSPDPGVPFTFSVSGASPSVANFSVSAGSCTFVNLSTPTGSVVVQELPFPDYQVVGIVFTVSLRGTVDVFHGRATAYITTNQVTEVTFINQFANSILKICKNLATGTTVPPGTLFRFSVSSYFQDVLVAAGTCTEIAVPAGQVTVIEKPLANYHVSNIQFLIGTGTVDIPNATAVADMVVHNVTEVAFTNQGKGFIQICKETVDGITGTFGFTSPSFAGTQLITLNKGATEPVCGGLIQVNSGLVQITELAAGDTVLFSARTQPTGYFVKLVGRTVSVVVPTTPNPANVVLVIFKNVRNGYIQICKQTDNGLTGTFYFTSTNLMNIDQSIKVKAGAQQPVCGQVMIVVKGQFTVTETPGTNFHLVGVTVKGGGSLISLVGNTATIRVETGNQAQEALVIFENAPNVGN